MVLSKINFVSRQEICIKPQDSGSMMIISLIILAQHGNLIALWTK